MMLLGGVSATLLGCGSTTRDSAAVGEDGASMADGSDSASNGSGGSGTSGGSGGGSSDGSGGSSSSGGASTGDSTATVGTTGTTSGGCVPGIPATSQVPRLLNREYDAILNDLLGISSLAAADDGPPSSLLNEDHQGEMDTYTWQAYLNAADLVAEQVMAGDNRSNFMSCDPAEDTSCYEDTIISFGRKMFRRPLTDHEVERFLALTTADPNWTPEEISEAILYAFLASPSFIMVPELSAVPEGDAFQLSSYEVATRLSLMLWGSVPDAELNAAADQDALTTSEQIRTQAERMIQARGKAGPQVSAANEYYVESSSPSSNWWKISHDPDLFPDFSDDARVALHSEVGAFFEEIAYEGGSFQDILLSNIAFVNRDSAALYGLDPAQYGADLTLVELDATERPGIFTRAGFLSSYSTYDATNPILRGALLATSVMGVDPGPSDPNALVGSLPAGDYATRREMIEALTSPAQCVACHNLINAPGYVLENFDAVGAWQDVDPLGGPIDSTADVTFADGSVKTISSALELMQAIAEDPTARHLYAQQLVAFFTGRTPNENDACMVDTIAERLADSDYGILDVVVDLTQADSFRLRTVSD